jgi:hypothetical protein
LVPPDYSTLSSQRDLRVVQRAAAPARRPLCENRRMATVLYQDRWITCEPDRLIIRGYYFPTGAPKVVPYRDIRRVTRIRLTTLGGRWRIWGTSDFRYWWHLDWSRPHKQVALVLDLGKRIKPVITPDDPDRVAAIIQERRGGAS